MTPAQALEAILPFVGHRAECYVLLEKGLTVCNCGVARAIQNAMEALSDAEPRVGPGKAEPDVVTHG